MMTAQMISLSDFPSHLATLTKADWQPLFDLIPEIEQTIVFGEEKGFELIEPGVRTFPYWEQSGVVVNFEKRAYDLGLVINFDWPKWDEGRKFASGDHSKIDNLDLITLCKLITAIIRNDRFCDGALIESFETGFMPRILKRMRDLIQNS